MRGYFASVLLLCAVALGCDGNSTGVSENIAGTYVLAGADFSPLPFTKALLNPQGSPIGTITVIDGKLILGADGTYTLTRNIRQATPSGVTPIAASESGTYSSKSGSVLLTSAAGTKQAATATKGIATVTTTDNFFLFLTLQK